MLDSAASDSSFSRQVKILIAGGFGVGKTTFVGAVSEIQPLTTEETITTASVNVDDLAGVEAKSTTTVAMDFGRITFPQKRLKLFLFGTPGQDRFWFMWDELCRGALGAVVIADTRRLDHCFPAVEFFLLRGIRFVVALNEFDGAFRYELEDIRAAIDLPHDIPLVRCDARNRHSATSVLITLLEFLIDANRTNAPSNSAVSQ